MKVLYAPDYDIEKASVVTFGKFDGLHEGHKKIIARVQEEAQNNNLYSIVYTFLENPKKILEIKQFEPLMSNDEKIKEIEKLKIDILVFENFNKEYANISSEDFVKKILVSGLKAKKVIMGSNSTFGRLGKGNIKLMRELGRKYNFEVIEMQLLKQDGKVISSTEIRKQRLQEKKIERNV